MGSKWLSLLLALSVLLALSISEVKNSGAHCPPCHENAKCYNTTHCVCKDGFQSKSARPIFSSYEKCEDIDECQTRMAQCKERAYCRNKIGSYICSCVAKYLRILSWVAGFLDIDQPECYKNKNQVTQSSGDIWENLWQCPGILCIVMIFGVIQWMETRDAAQYSRMNKNYPVTDENLRKNMSKKDFSRNATQILQEIEVDIWNKSLNSPGKGENSYFGIVYDSKRCHQANEKTFLEAGNNTMDIDCTDAFRPMRDRNGVALITYQSLGNVLDGSFFNNRRGLQGVQLNSRVVSGTIGLNQMVHLSKPVLLTFQHTQTGAAGMKYFCVYWEGSEEGGSWSMEGCSHVYSNESCTICKCSHLSSFAVLMALTPKEDPVLTLITYVGLSLSLLCLFLAALTFLLCRPIQNTSTSIHLQLSLCLFLAHLLFLTGINRTEPKVLCSVTAGALHYFYLASFIWMLLEGLHLFLTVRNLKVANYTSANRLKKRFMYPAGYGIPAVIVTVSAIVGHKNYGTYTHCWLKPEKGFIWSFMGPVAAIITINLVFYFQVLWILRSKLASLNKEVSTIQDTRVMTFKATAQLFVLGCSWGLGYFMVEEVGNTVGSVIAYSFTIINVLQGLLLFVVHCLLNRQVRMEYKKWFSGMRKGVETESTEMSHSTTHTKVVRPAPLQA